VVALGLLAYAVKLYFRKRNQFQQLERTLTKRLHHMHSLGILSTPCPVRKDGEGSATHVQGMLQYLCSQTERLALLRIEEHAAAHAIPNVAIQD
jgi:hypothetical protein